MAELYTGIAGSPITYLAGDISAEQTTIAVADDSALPDAPNICTIGYGEHIETIKYEAKSNGVLQNVTRGIEGTPRAWPSGTEVARFFTAHDHNAIIAELEDARLSDVKEKTFDDLKGRLEEIEQDHDTHLAESSTQFSRIDNVLQYYLPQRSVPYDSGDNRWRDLTGVGFYYAGTGVSGYPQSTGILIHIKNYTTSITWQMFLGTAGSVWTRKVVAADNFADVAWVQV